MIGQHKEVEKDFETNITATGRLSSETLENNCKWWNDKKNITDLPDANLYKIGIFAEACPIHDDDDKEEEDRKKRRMRKGGV